MEECNDNNTDFNIISLTKMKNCFTSLEYLHDNAAFCNKLAIISQKLRDNFLPANQICKNLNFDAFLNFDLLQTIFAYLETNTIALIDIDIDLTDSCVIYNEWNTLSIAIEQNDLQTMKEVLSYNPFLLSELNQSGYSLLQVAIASNRTEIVQLLLELDETMINILSSNMESAFSIALRQNNTEIVEILFPFIDISWEIKTLEETGNIHLLMNLMNSDFPLGEGHLALINNLLLGESNLDQ